MPESKRYRILVLEDDQGLAEAVASSLELAGHDPKAEVVTSKTKLEDVVAMTRAWKPDVILLDHTMPIDGTAFLAAFLAEPSTREIPVLLFTGSDNVPVEVRRLVATTVRKPFQMDGLVSLVENTVGMRQRNGARPS